MSDNNIILKVGKSYRFVDSVEILHNIPKGVYNLYVDPSTLSAELVETHDLVLPSPFYSEDSQFIEMVLRGYNHYSNNTGVLLEGDKGTGKTVTLKKIAIDSGLPVIIINNPITSNFSLSDFLNNIQTECVLLFDEFEKNFRIYSEEEKNITQEQLLNVFDGLNNSKKLILISSNQQIDNYYYNRPSRIRYYKRYKGISENLVKVIAMSLLEDKSFLDDLLDNINSENASIDIVSSIIKEVNLQKRKYSEFLEYFNYSKYLVDDNTRIYLDIYPDLDENDNIIDINHSEKAEFRINLGKPFIYYNYEKYFQDPNFPDLFYMTEMSNKNYKKKIKVNLSPISNKFKLTI